MHFDRAVNSRGAGIGVILITPEGEMIPMAKRLEFEVTNNQAEYEACIFGLEALRSVGAENVIVYGDSKLRKNGKSEKISCACIGTTWLLFCYPSISVNSSICRGKRTK